MWFPAPVTHMVPSAVPVWHCVQRCGGAFSPSIKPYSGSLEAGGTGAGGVEAGDDEACVLRLVHHLWGHEDTLPNITTLAWHGLAWRGRAGAEGTAPAHQCYVDGSSNGRLCMLQESDTDLAVVSGEMCCRQHMLLASACGNPCPGRVSCDSNGFAVALVFARYSSSMPRLGPWVLCGDLLIESVVSLMVKRTTCLHPLGACLRVMRTAMLCRWGLWRVCFPKPQASVRQEQRILLTMSSTRW